MLILGEKSEQRPPIPELPTETHHSLSRKTHQSLIRKTHQALSSPSSELELELILNLEISALKTLPLKNPYIKMVFAQLPLSAPSQEHRQPFLDSSLQ